VHVNLRRKIGELKSQIHHFKMGHLSYLQARETQLYHKKLLSVCGFLVYFTCAYPAMVPYLKVFHLTIEMRCGNHDEVGWKLSPKELASRTETRDSWLGTMDEKEAEQAYLFCKKMNMCTSIPPLSTPSSS